MKSSNRQITVFVGIVVRKNKVLIVKRSEPELKAVHLKWEFPGGKVDFGETPEEAVVREIKEETGVTVKVKRLLPMVQTVNWDYEWGTQQTLLFAYECEYINEKEGAYDHHVEETRWVNIEDYNEYESLPGGREFLEVLLSKTFSNN